MMRLVAIEPIEHDGKAIAPGDSFELPEAAALPLLACGAARQPQGDTASPPPAAVAAPGASRGRRGVLG